MNDYDAELRTLREKLARKSKIQTMLSSLQSQAAQLHAEQQRLDTLRLKEQADVSRLEGHSLAALFYAAVNQREQKLDKERAEACAAAAKYDSALRQETAVEGEIRSILAELSSLSGIEAEFNRAFEKKTEAVKESDPVRADRIRSLEDRLGYLAVQHREIDEALSIGETALSKISAIENALGSAEGWGTWDLLGGGLISTMAKHSHLDDAEAQVTDLQIVLRRYRTELSDVTIHADIQAQVEGFLRFADYFFDGLFVDWAVLDSIHNAQSQIDATRSQVADVQRQLVDMKRDITLEEAQLNEDLKNTILDA